MKIFIDESGLFIPTIKPNAYSVVAAYSILEEDLDHIEIELRVLKAENKFPVETEVKAKYFSEDSIIAFLDRLRFYKSSVEAVVMKMTNADTKKIEMHKNVQAFKIMENIGLMVHENGRIYVRNQYEFCRGLSNQLYAQYLAQLELSYATIRKNILHYLKRNPKSLKNWKWIFDAKDGLKPTKYELFIEQMSAGIIQSMSMRQPILVIEEYDVSCLDGYRFADGKTPDYLTDTYRLEKRPAIDAGKILRGDISFTDSKNEFGLQVIDIIVYSIGKCIRGEWRQNDLIAQLLGSLMIRDIKGGLSFRIMSFNNEETMVGVNARASNIMSRYAKPML
jgi:hypothetical protein